MQRREDFISADGCYGETKRPLKCYRGREREELEADNGSLSIIHTLFHPIHTTPNRLEMYVRMCVERIFSPLSFFSPTACYDSVQSLEQDWGERRRSVGLTCFFLSAALFLTETKSCLRAWLRTSKDRQIWRNSSVVGCVKEVGTATTSWLWKKSESSFLTPIFSLQATIDWWVWAQTKHCISCACPRERYRNKYIQVDSWFGSKAQCDGNWAAPSTSWVWHHRTTDRFIHLNKKMDVKLMSL